MPPNTLHIGKREQLSYSWLFHIVLHGFLSIAWNEMKLMLLKWSHLSFALRHDLRVDCQLTTGLDTFQETILYLHCMWVACVSLLFFVNGQSQLTCRCLTNGCSFHSCHSCADITSCRGSSYLHGSYSETPCYSCNSLPRQSVLINAFADWWPECYNYAELEFLLVLQFSYSHAASVVLKGQNAKIV